jgi:PKD repeat protein
MPPDVPAGSDITTEVNQSVTFSGSFIDINPGDTHTIQWDFGDGATATGTLTATHTYTNTDVYTATLTVEDNTGFVISDTLQVQVNAAGTNSHEHGAERVRRLHRTTPRVHAG